MKVTIKDLYVNMDLGTNGIELEVRHNDGSHWGDLRIGKATIEWCEGRKRKGNGIQISWHQLIELIESR